MVETPNITHLFPQKPGGITLPTAYQIAHAWHARRPEIIRAAVAASEWAFSHRQLKSRHPTRVARYASAVLGARFGRTLEQQLVVASGWNFKLLKGSGIARQYHPTEFYKLCSEPDAIVSGVSMGCVLFHGLALYSANMQREDVSGVFCNIQHPCAACREYLFWWLKPESPLILIRPRLPCDLDPHAQYLSADCVTAADPRAFTPGDLVVEDWTYDESCKHHAHKIRTGRP